MFENLIYVLVLLFVYTIVNLLKHNEVKRDNKEIINKLNEINCNLKNHISEINNNLNKILKLLIEKG